jgi:hypothetical protein
MPTDDSYSYGGVVVQPDSKIVVAGAVSIGGMALIRYTTTGALDPTFGFARGDVVSALGGAEDLVRQPDGKFVVAGVKVVSETTPSSWSPDSSVQVRWTARSTEGRDHRSRRGRPGSSGRSSAGRENRPRGHFGANLERIHGSRRLPRLLGTWA